MSYPRLIRAFTLTELSVVLVILALLSAAVAGGIALKRTAQLEAIVFEINNIKIATNHFRWRYNFWPGDINYATTIWPNGGTANGNGDGIINGNYLGASNPETLRAWQHLQLALLYPGTFPGTSNASAPYVTADVNAPASRKIPGLYYFYSVSGTGGTNVFSRTSGNLMHFGATGTCDNSTQGAILNPIDAKFIDTKLDDGVANAGVILGVDANCSAAGSCSSTWNSNLGADYNLSSTSVSCRMFIFFE